jgi:hypothetical protein
VSGEVALTLGNAAQPFGASWSSQGTIVFARTLGVLQQVSDAGGTPQPLTRLEKGDTGHRWPEFLPGEKAVLFAGGAFTDPRIAVFSIGTGERQNLAQGHGESYPRYAPSGHLVYAQGGSLMAVPFDPRRLTVTGAAVPVLQGVAQSTINGSAQYSISATGSLAYVSGGY